MTALVLPSVTPKQLTHRGTTGWWKGAAGRRAGRYWGRGGPSCSLPDRAHPRGCCQHRAQSPGRLWQEGQHPQEDHMRAPDFRQLTTGRAGCPHTPSHHSTRQATPTLSTDSSLEVQARDKEQYITQERPMLLSLPLLVVSSGEHFCWWGLPRTGLPQRAHSGQMPVAQHTSTCAQWGDPRQGYVQGKHKAPGVAPEGGAGPGPSEAPT